MDMWFQQIGDILVLLATSSNGLQPNSDGLHPSSFGLLCQLCSGRSQLGVVPFFDTELFVPPETLRRGYGYVSSLQYSHRFGRRSVQLKGMSGNWIRGHGEFRMDYMFCLPD